VDRGTVLRLGAAIFIIMNLPQRSSRPEQLLLFVMAVFSGGTGCSDAALDFEISGAGKVDFDDSTRGKPASKSTGKPLKPLMN